MVTSFTGDPIVVSSGLSDTCSGLSGRGELQKIYILATAKVRANTTFFLSESQPDSKKFHSQYNSKIANTVTYIFIQSYKTRFAYQQVALVESANQMSADSKSARLTI